MQVPPSIEMTKLDSFVPLMANTIYIQDHKINGNLDGFDPKDLLIFNNYITSPTKKKKKLKIKK